MKLIDLLESSGSKILYRAISVMGDVVEQLKKEKTTGTSWTDDKGSARVYRDIHRGYGETYILVAKVDDKDIDLKKTKELNNMPVRGTFEKEVRLKKGITVRVNSILDEKGKKVSSPNLNLKTV